MILRGQVGICKGQRRRLSDAASCFWRCTMCRYLEFSHCNKQVDLMTPPWPEISGPAKDLVLKLLNRDPSSRLTAQQVYYCSWLCC